MHFCPQEIALVTAACTCLACLRGWVRRALVAAAWWVIDRLDP